MGLINLTFRALGPETLAMAWPAFVVFGAGQIAFVSYIRRHGPPGRFWTIVVVIAAITALAAFGIVSERTVVQLIAREGLQPVHESPLERLLNVVRWSTGPTIWVFALCQAVLLARLRSYVLVATLAAMSGTALSWAVAIWLAQQPLPDILLRLLQLPGAFGVVVASLGVFAKHVVHPERSEKNGVATHQFDSEEAPDEAPS